MLQNLFSSIAAPYMEVLSLLHRGQAAYVCVYGGACGCEVNEFYEILDGNGGGEESVSVSAESDDELFLEEQVCKCRTFWILDFGGPEVLCCCAENVEDTKFKVVGKQRCKQSKHPTFPK